MNFDVQHSFAGITAADYERLYVDETFNAELCAYLKLDRELLLLKEDQGQVERQVRVTPDREIPAPAAKVMGSSRISYVETLTYTLGSGRGQWSTASSVLPDKIESFGNLAITQVGNAVVRRVTGQITVRIFGLGKVVERFIVADVVRSYAEAARFTEAYVQRSARH
jgi:hypothetical protein